MKKTAVMAIGFCVVLCGIHSGARAAAGNTGNDLTFLVFDVVSNSYHAFSPDGVDVGIDIGADGTVEYWMSEDPVIVTRQSSEPRNTVGPNNWKRIVVRLSEYAGQTAKIRLVDNSATGFIAVNSIRLNNADGTMVPNNVPNGFFEDTPSLTGWTVTGGDLTSGQLIVQDTGLSATPYSTSYLTTQVNGMGDTATIESDSFELTPAGSFIYGTFAGPASSRWDKPGAHGSDNGIFVYVDLGTTTEDPDGQYTEGADIPLTGFLWHNHEGAMDTTVIDTSGYEGRRAQLVAGDVSATDGISLDAIRMNWDHTTIRNGGFEEGFEGGIVPDGFEGTNVRLPEEHPTGKIPGWTMNSIPDLNGNPIDDPDATFTFFGHPGAGFSRSDLVWVGSGSFETGQEDLGLAGVELRSDVFVIQPVPDPTQNVFLSFHSGQNSTRVEDAIDPNDGTGEDRKNTIELRVDMDANGTFDDDADFTYRQFDQGIAWNGIQKDGVDEWQFPDYRMYIAPEHQGKQGQIYVADTLTGSWAWMAADDFYFWDGQTADLAFPNSDFEMGNLTNWTEEIATPSLFDSWLVSTPANVDAGLATDWFMNRTERSVWVDGEFGIDSADRNTSGGGDNQLGAIWSDPFTIPTLRGTSVEDWHLFE